MAPSFANAPPKTKSSKKTKKPTRRSTMYHSAIPALPPVANPAARAALPSAPAVAPNTPLDNELLLQAVTEHRMRKVGIETATVTPDEVLDAKKRMLAVLSEHVVHDYPGAPLPNNAILAGVTTAVNQAMDRVDHRLVAMDRRLVAMDRRLVTMDRRFNARIDALYEAIVDQFDAVDDRLNALDNASRKEHNVRIEQRTATNPWVRRLQLRPYLRVNPAYGPGYPGGPDVVVQDVEMGDEYPAPPFPRTIQALNAMSQREIMQLSVMMDNDFGIERGDPHDIRRNKVSVHLFYGI